MASLEAVQPAERTIGQFTPEMGAHWTPPELVQGFLREYLGDRTLNVSHDDRYGWILNTGRVPEANNVMYGVPAVEPDPDNGIKGNKGKNAAEIARAILGYGSLTVYEDDKRKEVDEATSRLIRQKADQMRADFATYATANADRLTTLTDSYNRIMNGHVVRSYEGMSPTLEGYTPDRNPHPWQLTGAARMQFERGVILAHEVGLGKTGTLVMGTQALKASGQINKPMAVVPNGLAKQWADEARFLYPNADVHLITSADLAGDRRNSTLEWLRANRPDLVIFTEEAFGSIKMSPEAQDEYEFRELEALREQLDRQYEDADNPSHPFIVAKIEQRIATVSKNINKNAAPMRKPGETYWDDLGFDYFVVDEAHRYKGVGFRSKEGGGDPASIRGVDLHQKTEDLHRRRAGRATITLATGTPLSNSISEQFTMLSFASPWVLDAYRAGAPDLWANTFGRKTLRIENAPDGSGLRVVERFSEFHNKRAMKTMWGLTADTKRAEDVGIPRPKVKGGAPNLIMVDRTPDQKKRLGKLIERGRAIHSGEVDRHEDNMLAVSNEGTSVALDPRLVDPNAPAGNKLKAVADRHIERYHATKDRVYKVAYGSSEDHPVPGALQMIFLNEGVPGGKKKRSDFDAYAELKQLMVAGGIPADKIAFVQDAKKSGKPEDMTELFRRAREGEISVMIGSSAVAGVGMNAQDRMVSLSHVDLDWGAAQMEQRNGRILRYGNMNPEVEIDIFATKGSMDGWKAASSPRRRRAWSTSSGRSRKTATPAMSSRKSTEPNSTTRRWKPRSAATPT
ncbi:DEAD/DEAH box helicase family protein [Streptomyces sp. MT29]|nr:DEAD/DEAH box helicase family protein [Streptomyces sp. MT29]